MSRRAFLAAVSLSVPLATAAPAPPAVVPAPASITARAGSFAVTRSTALVVDAGDVGAQRVAGNLADLLSRSHGLRLRVRHDRPARTIVLRRARDLPAEGYRIVVDARGATLSASTEAGLAHATATLWQLAARTPAGATIPALSIEDAPRFAWRGVMLDSAGNFQSPEFIRRFIDWMALHKLNVLHWHLADGQAWRLEIRKHPRLAHVGGWRVPAGAAARQNLDSATGKPRLHGGYYSQETVRALVAYAAERGIDVVPGIGMPAHAGDAAVELVEDILREAMALFPSRYIHAGGIVDPLQPQAQSTQRIARLLESNGRRLAGWEGVPEGRAHRAVVMARGLDGAVAAAARGHDTVLAVHPTLHFDNVQALSAREPPGRGRVVSLRDVYELEPMPAAIPAGQQRHVLGLQGNVWTEHIRTEARVAWMTFPRAAAVAELGWSRPERRGWEDFQRRMAALSSRYAAVGLPARPLREPPPARAPRGTYRSHDLAPCTSQEPLALEDDAPLAGNRATFLVDVQDPCWIARGVRLDRVRAIVARVGQVPLTFQRGEDAKGIRFAQAATPEGELEARAPGCEGELLARLPLAPALVSHEVTELPSAPVAERAGTHDVCFRFAQRGLDPLWVVDSVTFRESR